MKFEDLLRDYEQYVNPANTKRYSRREEERILYSIATACAYSVLKKCINVSGDKQLMQKRSNVARSMSNMNRSENIADKIFDLHYNSDGDLKEIVTDTELKSAYDKLCAESMLEGFDLVHDAFVSLQQQTEEQKKRVFCRLYDELGNVIYEGYEPQENTPCKRVEKIEGLELVGWTEIPYEHRQLRQHVVIKNAESKGAWQTEQTTPIQEVFKAVRRAIHASGSVKSDPRNGYSYLAEMCRDEESGLDEVIYRRYGKYADIGGYAVDANNSPTTYSADDETAFKIYDEMSRLNLSKQQREILELKLQGYGSKSIATYLGVKKDGVNVQLRRIQEKTGCSRLVKIACEDNSRIGGLISEYWIIAKEDEKLLNLINAVLDDIKSVDDVKDTSKEKQERLDNLIKNWCILALSMKRSKFKTARLYKYFANEIKKRIPTE